MLKVVWADHHREALNPKHWQGFLPDHILKAWPRDKYLMVLCVGIVHSTGDSLGPLVGTELLKRKVLDLNTTGVCGSLAEPVHLLNVLDTWRDIQQNYANFWTLVVDSALTQDVGLDNLQFGVGPSHPASGAGHNLPGVGEAALLGCVGLLSMPKLMHGASLYKVHCLADAIVETILAISRARAAGSETALPFLQV